MANRWFDVHAFRIGGAAGGKVAVLFTNITERRNAEQQALALAGTLAEQDRRKDEFLAMLSHALRNPRAPISNAVHLLDLQTDECALQKQARQVGHLLEVSRITTGQVQLRCAPVTLAPRLGQRRPGLRAGPGPAVCFAPWVNSI